MVNDDWLFKGSAFLKICLTEKIRSRSETDHILKNSIHRYIHRLVWRKMRIHAGLVKKSSVCILKWWMFRVEFDSAYLLWTQGYFCVLVIVFSLHWLKFGWSLLALIFMLSCVEAVGSGVKIDEMWFAVVLRVEAFSVDVEASFQYKLVFWLGGSSSLLVVASKRDQGVGAPFQ